MNFVKSVRISIIEDNPNTAKFLKETIEESSHYNFHHAFKSGDAALRHYQMGTLLPEIVILDLGLPGKHGSQIIQPLKALNTNIKVLIFTSVEEVEMIIECLERGADGYLLKDIDGPLLIAELDVMRHGGAPMTAGIAGKLLKREKENFSLKKNLSEKELAVLQFISVNLSYNDIAEKLSLSPHTVRRHIERIYKKMNVHSKYEAVEIGKQIGAI
jgi:DNA-binding NarL/FixJ family response regulator